jgi:hypothetical protein
MAANVLGGMFSAGAFENTKCKSQATCEYFLYQQVASTRETRAVGLKVASTSAVLLKNSRATHTHTKIGTRATLPLNWKPDIVVVGSACDARQWALPRGPGWDTQDYMTLGGSGRVHAAATRSLLQALQARGARVVGVSPQNNVDLAMQAGYGGAVDVVIACGGSTSEEGFDRDSLKLDQHVFLTELSRRHALHKEPKPRLVIAAFAPGAIVAPWAALADSAAILARLWRDFSSCLM